MHADAYNHLRAMLLSLGAAYDNEENNLHLQEEWWGHKKVFLLIFLELLHRSERDHEETKKRGGGGKVCEDPLRRGSSTTGHQCHRKPRVTNTAIFRTRGRQMVVTYFFFNTVA
jgi:hypothetical protein